MPPRSYEPPSRSDHLKNLVRVFRRRGCDWEDFAAFLGWLFENPSSPHALSVLPCRHDPARGPQSHTPTEYPPCRTSGTKDNGKAMKFVSFDIRELARKWCTDNTFEKLKVNAPAFPIALDWAEIDFERDESLDQAVGAGCDAWVEEAGLRMGAEHSSSPLHSSDAGAARVTTGIRVHVLAYLAGYRNDMVALQSAYHRLRDTSLPILHLCGCGICGPGKGCTEPTHLRLGTQAENITHAHCHAVLSCLTVDRQEYETVRGIINSRVPNGAGLI